MGKYLDRARELREDPNIHYNCAQAVFIPFAESAGMTTQQAFDIAANFGAGMRVGSVCGAITGGLMALGVMGLGDPDSAVRFRKHFIEAHDGMTDCRDLLGANMKRGVPRKVHCDGMVYEAVTVVGQMLEEKE